MAARWERSAPVVPVVPVVPGSARVSAIGRDSLTGRGQGVGWGRGRSRQRDDVGIVPSAASRSGAPPGRRSAMARKSSRVSMATQSQAPWPIRRAGRLPRLVTAGVILAVSIGLLVAGGVDEPGQRGAVSSGPSGPGASSQPAAGLASPTAASPSSFEPSPPPTRQLVREGWRTSAGAVARAEELLANLYPFRNMPTVELPADPRWHENPLKSRNWEFQYHTLRFVLDLTAAFSETGHARYLDRARYLLRDWVEDNPRQAGRSVFSWNDHATAWRSVVLVCAAELLEDEPWLRNALILHGQT